MKKARVLSLLLALVMGLSLLSPAAAAEDTTASVLKLTKTTGTVNVNKSSGKSIALRSDLRLYNGYHVTTGQSSYAWINLDDTKLLKEDAASEVEVRKQGKKLEVNLSAGNVFFDVSEKLDSDESLNISTSTMVAGIRGTSGWVEIESRTQSRFYVLDGSVQCTVSDPVTGQRRLETVDAGEMVECVVYEAGDGENDRCGIIRQEFEVSDIPGSVLTQLVEDVPLCDRILEDSGMDVLAELAKTAGGDPSGRTPDGRGASPEVLGQAQAQQARDEAETAEKLKKIQEEQDKQANSVASDVAWWEPLKATYANGTLTISGKGAIVESFPEFRQNLLSISSVVIEEGVTSIETSAFFEGKFDTVTIPKSMTYINPNAFYMCNVLKDVYYNGTKAEWAKVTNGAYAVNHTTPTPRVVTIHCSDGIFTHTVTFDPNGGTVTPTTATTGEDGKLASWPTPTREGYTFNGWYTEAEGGRQATTDAVFTDDITLYAQWTQNSSAVGGTDWNIDNNGTLYITSIGPMENYNSYSASTRAPWDDQREEITSIVIGDQVTGIGSNAFWNCTNVTSVTIPSGVTSIGFGAFMGCAGLTSVTIPDGVTSIGDSAFDGCTSLTSVTIPDGVTSIGDFVFDRCTSLTSVTIPDGVTGIGDYAFDGCTNLASVTIPDSVKSIGDYAFDGCSGLTSVTIPSSVIRIGEHAFLNCTGLTSVTIPSSVTGISQSAFYGCTGLTDVTIPDSVTSIGNSAFNGCTGLTSVTIPTSVTTIGLGAFNRCTGLTDIHFGGTIAQWNTLAANAGVPSGVTVHCSDGDITTT